VIEDEGGMVDSYVLETLDELVRHVAEQGEAS
jgi:hypothetical protein